MFITSTEEENGYLQRKKERKKKDAGAPSNGNRDVNVVIA